MYPLPIPEPQTTAWPKTKISQWESLICILSLAFPLVHSQEFDRSKLHLYRDFCLLSSIIFFLCHPSLTTGFSGWSTYSGSLFSKYKHLKKKKSRWCRCQCQNHNPFNSSSLKVFLVHFLISFHELMQCHVAVLHLKSFSFHSKDNVQNLQMTVGKTGSFGISQISGTAGRWHSHPGKGYTTGTAGHGSICKHRKIFSSFFLH